MYKFFVAQDQISDENIKIIGEDVNHIVNVLRELKQKVKKEIENLTSMNVQEVSVLAKGIVMPENGIKT